MQSKGVSKPIKFLDSDYKLTFGSEESKRFFITKLLDSPELEFEIATSSTPYKDGEVVPVSYEYPMLLDLNKIEEVPLANKAARLCVTTRNSHYRYNWDNAGTNKDEIERVELVNGEWVHVDVDDPVEDKLEKLKAEEA